MQNTIHNAKASRYISCIISLLLITVLAACSQAPQPSAEVISEDTNLETTNLRFPNGNGYRQEQLLGDYASLAVEFADFNNDNFLDAWVVQAGGTSQVYLNDRHGRLQYNRTYLSYKAKEVALGDMDNDGDIDALVVGGTGMYFYANNGHGYFGTTPQQISSTPSMDVEIANIDNDNLGRLDAWVTNTNQTDTVYFNTSTHGQLTLTASAQTIGFNNSHNATLHDIDNDGDIDAWVITPLHHIIYANQGQGNFVQAQILFNQAVGATDVALGNVDGNGHADAWVSHSKLGNQAYTQPNQLYRGNNSGSNISFTHTGITLGASDSKAIKLVDVDNDNDLDVWVANVGANKVYINNAGTFTISGRTYGNYKSSDVAVGDLDNDGDMDVVVTNMGMGYNVRNEDIFYRNNHILNPHVSIIDREPMGPQPVGPQPLGPSFTSP